MSETELIPEVPSVKWRWRNGVLVLLLIAAGTALFLIYSSNIAPRYVRKWCDVSHGMSKDQVLDLLGEPTGKNGPATVKCDGDSEPTIAAAAGLGAAIFGSLDEYWTWESRPDGFESWSDEDKGKYVFSALFGPSKESFVVYFDQQGRVSKRRPPIAGPYASRYEEIANTE